MTTTTLPTARQAVGNCIEVSAEEANALVSVLMEFMSSAASDVSHAADHWYRTPPSNSELYGTQDQIKGMAAAVHTLRCLLSNCGPYGIERHVYADSDFPALLSVASQQLQAARTSDNTEDLGNARTALRTLTELESRGPVDDPEDFANRVLTQAFARIATHPDWSPDQAEEWRDEAAIARARVAIADEAAR